MPKQSTRANESTLRQRAFNAGKVWGKKRYDELRRRHKTKQVKLRRRRMLIRSGEVAAAAGASGALRGWIGDKMDVVGVPLEGPIGVVLHLVGGGLYPDKPQAEHLHAIGDGLLASGASRGVERLVKKARERYGRSEPAAPPASATTPAIVVGEALPAPPTLALPPPPLYPPASYAPAVAGGVTVASADRALAEAVAVMEQARADGSGR